MHNLKSEQQKKRADNAYRILRSIQALGPLTRSEISGHCNIRKSSVGSIVDELMIGNIIEREYEDRVRGPIVYCTESFFVASVK